MQPADVDSPIGRTFVPIVREI